MSEPLRLWAAGIALFVYAALILQKAVRIRSLSRRAEAAASGERRLLRVFRLDLIRMTADGAMLAAFLLSGLCPAWFSLFPETTWGVCTGCVILISITLLLSIFVDWFPVRDSCRLSGREAPSFRSFLLRQLASILRIEAVLAAVWGIYGILESMKVPPALQHIAAGLALLLVRLLLLRARKNRGS